MVHAHYYRSPGVLKCPECGAEQGVACIGCGAPRRSRQHVLPDFLVGGHAEVQADRLLWRDRGLYGTYFPDLTVEA